MVSVDRPRIFLAHSSVDKEFVENLARRLTLDGISVWYDAWEIRVGDSIVEKINEGISSSDFLVVVLSNNSVSSNWVQQELNAGTIRNINEKGAFILPVLLEKCEIPPLLSDKRYADFLTSPDVAYRELIEAINYNLKIRTQQEKGQEEVIMRESPDILQPSEDSGFKNIESRWLDLLEEDNQIRIQRNLRQLRSQIKECFPDVIELGGEPASEDTKKKLRDALDRVAIMLLTLVRYKHKPLRPDLLELLAYAYGLVAGPDRSMSGDYPIGRQAELWVAIISRAYAIGAASLYLRDYEAVKSIIEIRPTWSEYWAELYWARHAQVMYARSKPSQKKGLVALAGEYMKESPWVTQNFDDDYEEGLSYLCQFDLLQCLFVLYKTKNFELSYPSFGQFRNRRVFPLLIELVEKNGAYEVLSGMSDEELAAALMNLDNRAAHEWFAVRSWARGIWPAKVIEFLKRHAPKG